MGETRKLRFMVPRGYNGVIIARGALIEVSEPWASRFIADGTCEIVEEKRMLREGKSESEPPQAQKSSKKKR